MGTEEKTANNRYSFTVDLKILIIINELSDCERKIMFLAYLVGFSD